MKRLAWFGQLEVDHSLYDVEQEVILWRAVIDQAIEDALSTDTDREARMLRLRARVWFNDNIEDFEEVCYLAQLPDDMVRSKVKYLMENYNEKENSNTGGTGQGSEE